MEQNSSVGSALLPFFDPRLSEAERIDDLISRMTLEEKVDCLSTNPSVPRLGVRCTGHVEGLHGLTLGGSGEWGKYGGGLPVPTTTFPQAIGLAETWDPDLVKAVATVEAIETRYAFHHPRYRRGGLVVRAPNADLGRDPRWGRTEECYGEDPFLTATLTVAFVQGLQGEHPRYWRTASLLKHFLANSNENDREKSSSDFDARLFREYYSYPFYRGVVEGGARAYMAAYNAYNGVPCAVHPMLRDVTVREWGQDGIICTDGGGFKLLVTAHEAFPDLETAAAATIRAGITQYLDEFREAVLGALARGLVTEAEIEENIRGNLRVMLRLGLLDPPELVPYAAVAETDEEPWNDPRHHAFVREVTAKSAVLLVNRTALLPLDVTQLRTLAVVGPLADRVLIDWYSGTPPYTISPLEGIRRHVGDRVRVLAATNNDPSDAVRIAHEADVVIVCVGNHPTGDAGWAEITRACDGKEAVDRRALDLYDEPLVKKVLAVNPRTVLVLISSFPFSINWSHEHVPAILHLTHNSQELGAGLADVLFGAVSPGGRLVQTWPRSLADLPPMMDYSLTGRTYRYATAEPLYPFGHGLSYTSFAYSSLTTSAATFDPNDGPLTVSCEVTNTGARRGDEVVQLYARFLDSAIPRAQLALVGFRRVTLDPGETRQVELSLPGRALAYWNEALGRFVVERGQVELCAGASSADLRLRHTIAVLATA